MNMKLVLGLVLIVGMVMCGTVSARTQTIGGPYFTGNNTITDIFGNIVVTNGSVNASVGGLFGTPQNALGFNGATDYFDVYDNVTISKTILGTNFTAFAGWIYPVSLSNSPVIQSRVVDSLNRRFLELNYNASTGKANIAFVSSVGGTQNENWNTNSWNVSVNTWQYVVVGANGTVPHIYLNGIDESLEVVVNSSTNRTTLNAPLRIGSYA